MTLVDLLAVNGAVRFGDYSTVGNVNSWQTGGVYAPFPDLRVRGNLSRTVRAPNISELFSPLTNFTLRPNDPCDANFINRGPNPTQRLANCRADGIPAGFVDPLTARFNGLQGGNPNLKEETSDSYTYGIVLTPTFLPGFNATVDYWNIKIENAIAFPQAQEIVDACYDSPSLNNQFCQSFTRNRNAGSQTFLGLNGLTRRQLNFARFEASGIDFGVDYAFELANLGIGEAGILSMGVTGTWTENNTIFQSANDPNAKNPELGELDVPRWAVNPRLSWSYQGLTVGWTGYWRSNQMLRGVEIENRATFSNPETGASWVHDVQAGYEITENIRVAAGINNITDVEPFSTETNRPASAMGRAYYARLNVRY